MCILHVYMFSVVIFFNIYDTIDYINNANIL